MSQAVILKQAALQLFDLTTKQVGASIRALPNEALNDRPEAWFGVAEQVMHLVQADNFNLSWVSVLAEGGQYQPRGKFLSLMSMPTAQRKVELANLNLSAARTSTTEFATLESLIALWGKKRQEVRDRLERMSDIYWLREISHPLVEGLSGSVWLVCVELFCFHSYYHGGQLTQGVKAMGLKLHVPFTG